MSLLGRKNESLHAVSLVYMAASSAENCVKKMYHLTVCSLFNTDQQMQSHSIALCQWEYIDRDHLLYEISVINMYYCKPPL